MEETKLLVPFDSFAAVYKIMLWAGYYKLDKRNETWKKSLYEIYRFFAVTVVTIYNLQYFIYTLKARHDIAKLVESLMLEIPHTNLWVKVLTVFFQIKEIQKLNEFLKDSIFCTTTEAGQKLLQENVKEMKRLSDTVCIGGVTLAGSVWACSSIAKRISGEYDVIPMYFPYRTDTPLGFVFLVLNQCGPMLWIGYGHIVLDVLFATYYAQAHTQLKIIQQELHELLNHETHNDEDYLKLGFEYKDLSDKSVKERFVLVVKKYKKLIWYVKEVDTIFNVPLTFQFITSTAAVCFVVYNTTKINAASFQMMFLIILFFVLTTQVYLYCHFGNFVYHESQFLNDSLYNSDWLSLSPSFRRLLLIAMAVWSKPVQPTVCGMVRLSLSTFFYIIKSSYTLYTVLITTNNDN